GPWDRPESVLKSSSRLARLARHPLPHESPLTGVPSRRDTREGYYRRRQRDRDESRRFLGRPRSAPWFAPYDLDGGGRIAVQIVGGSRPYGPQAAACGR